MEQQLGAGAGGTLTETAADREIQRWATLAGAAAMAAYGLTRRSKSGALLAAAAVPLAYRGLAGGWPSLRWRNTSDTREALSGDRGVHVLETVRIARPAEELYSFWRRLENLPSFMSNLVRVTETAGGRSHWVARGPGGVEVEWDAEVVNEVENELIGWRSLPAPRSGALRSVATAGSVNFGRVGDGRSTQVTVHLQYAPPAGRFGALVARLFGREPSQTIGEDLLRLKRLLER